MTITVQGGGSVLCSKARTGSKHFSCACIYKVHNNKLYVLLRLYKEEGGEKKCSFKLPGGNQEPGETPLETFERELREELCLNTTGITYSDVLFRKKMKDGHEKFVFAKRYQGEKLRHCVMIEPGYKEDLTETLHKPMWFEVSHALQDPRVQLTPFYRDALYMLLHKVSLTENLTMAYRPVLKQFGPMESLS